jgi:hypothetical protein
MRLFTSLAALALFSALSACVAAPPAQVSKALSEGNAARDALPAMQAFAPAAPIPASRGNTEMAGDFLDLVFRMESGRALPVLTRFEGPITVALTGAVPATAPAEAARVVARLRAEAGLDIALVPAGRAASVTVEFQPRSALRRAVPTAACFVVPNVASLGEYKRLRGAAVTDWGRITRRDKVAIFVPSDTNPQEVRDCLHEELAQALGPLNDLYRLPDSVFNDDNFHAVLTGFDMLMLRVHYAAELRSGMNEAEVAARLPALLARLNPRGQGIGGGPKGLSPRSWIATVEKTFTAQNGARLDGAERMVSIARAQGWQDTRMAFGHFARARGRMPGDPAGALADYREAARLWRAQPGAAIHVAHAEMQLAAFALSAGQMDQALALAEAAIPVARRHQNASLLSSLLAMKAEALEAMGRAEAARAARLDSLGWARYAFGSEAQARARMQDIAALAAQGRRG